MLAPLVRASATRLALGAARPPAARRLPSLAAAFSRPSSSTSPLFGSSSSSIFSGGSSRHAHVLSPSTVTVRQHSKPPQATATVAAEAFADLPLSQSLLAALAERGLERPTEIQAVAVPALVNDRTSDFLLASHTGSGKTLAYLLPIGMEARAGRLRALRATAISCGCSDCTFTVSCAAASCSLAVQLLKEAEELGSPPAKSRRPKALVLGPTRELTDQACAGACEPSIAVLS